MKDSNDDEGQPEKEAGFSAGAGYLHSSIFWRTLLYNTSVRCVGGERHKNDQLVGWEESRRDVVSDDVSFVNALPFSMKRWRMSPAGDGGEGGVWGRRDGTERKRKHSNTKYRSAPRGVVDVTLEARPEIDHAHRLAQLLLELKCTRRVGRTTSCIPSSTLIHAHPPRISTAHSSPRQRQPHCCCCSILYGHARGGFPLKLDRSHLDPFNPSSCESRPPRPSQK